MGMFEFLKKDKRPGMTSGEADVYTKGETRNQDSLYYDIYADSKRERGNPLAPTSKWYIPTFTTLATVTASAIVFGAVPLMWSVSSQLLSTEAFRMIGLTNLFGDIPEGGLSYTEALKKVAYGNFWSGIFSFGAVALTGLGVYDFTRRYWLKENAGRVHNDIDAYVNDAYIKTPEQLPFDFDVFPDVGAHSDGNSPTALLSHIMIDNKGIKKIEMPKLDENGEPIYDEDDNLVLEKKPMFDTEFAHDLYTASFIPKGKAGSKIRHFYDATKLLYNPDKRFGKAQQKTLAEHINEHWTFPVYERQRPAGAYIVDTDPNNTMVLAMTRAGKGQTIIEPTIDMWTREGVTHNIAINDPKGELYTSFYYPASKRGYEVISFNLINPTRTNIYNPLGYAVEASRQGDNQQVEELVGSIGDVFFSTKNASEPMWNNAANAAFKRTALGLIDYYQEEEVEMREEARRKGWNQNVLDQKLDEMWGRVTLYNVYQMMTELSSKKSNDVDFIHLDDDDPSEEKDYLSLFFDATNKLPSNSLRESISNQDSALRTMAVADKTIASVYGISLTAMLFFADEKISRLTSGRPSQNFDMTGLGFPRRMGVRFDREFMTKVNFMSKRIRFTCYRDKEFTDKYEGEDYMHEGTVNSNGWCYAFFKGIFENVKTYIKLEIIDDLTELVAGSYYFEFSKGFQKSMNGRTFVEHPVHKTRIVKGGTLVEILRKRIPLKDEQGNIKKDVHGRTLYETVTNSEGKQVTKYEFVKGTSKTKRKRTILYDTDTKKAGDIVVEAVPIFIQNEVFYSEEQKMIFFITPPHLMAYAKVILILLNQMFNMQVAKAYLTKSNQKPMYKTRYMLDEVGNLQSEGDGIPSLETKASIGLGQDQQYTLILQTFQQLKEVYGDSIEKILQGNTGNIIYLKSTDDSMLSTLEGLSGTRHKAYTDSKTVTTDLDSMVGQNDGKISRTTTTREEPVISKNDMLFVQPCNSMVFGKGHPIWSKNQTALPMAYKLHETQLRDTDTLPKGERKYALNNVPTTTNTDGFNILKNKPDFMKMVSKRVAQARLAPAITETYEKFIKEDVEKDRKATEIMRNVNEHLANEKESGNDIVEQQEEGLKHTQEESDVVKEGEKYKAEVRDWAVKRYGQGTISRNDLREYPRMGGNYRKDMDIVIAEVYEQCKGYFKTDSKFQMKGDTLLDKDGQVFIRERSESVGNLYESSRNQDSNIKAIPENEGGFTDDVKDVTSAMKYEIRNEFYDYLCELSTWKEVAGGHFDKLMKEEFARKNLQDKNLATS